MSSINHTTGCSDAPFTDRLPGRELRAAHTIETLQVNLGLFCNLACHHCHVESSPKRTADDENMSAETADRLLQWLRDNPGIRYLDLTGGSPEANPQFRKLVEAATEMGISVTDRCNPTIIGFQNSDGSGFGWVPEFLAKHRVTVIASLPCYLEDNVRKQRGVGSFNASIDGLLALNRVGYGIREDLPLHLVYNPVGPHLPPPVEKLAEDYHRELKLRYDLQFHDLLTITNMPIQRWRKDLERQGFLEKYLQLLREAFNPETVSRLMCRHQIHVDSQGRIYDCDFNYALRLPVPAAGERHLWEFQLQDLQNRSIATGEHCFGCTAGCGSSCGGALV